MRAPSIPTVNTCPEGAPATAAEPSSFTNNGKLELPTSAIAQSTYGRRCSHDFSAGGDARLVREELTEASAAAAVCEAYLQSVERTLSHAVCGAYLAITRITDRSSVTLSAYVCTMTLRAFRVKCIACMCALVCTKCVSATWHVSNQNKAMQMQAKVVEAVFSGTYAA